MHRHPELSRRIPQNFTCIRAGISEEKIRSWYAHIKKYLEGKNLLNIPPGRIFNLDESAFKLVPKADKVIAPRGARAVYQIFSGSEKATVTVLFTASATGTLAPPLILFELKTMPRRQKKSEVSALEEILKIKQEKI